MSTEIETITAADFKKLVKTHAMRSEKMIEACRLVFVEGETRRAASIAAGVDYASLHASLPTNAIRHLLEQTGLTFEQFIQDCPNALTP